MLPRLVAFDLDNTLLDGEGGLSSQNARAVERLQSLGVYVAVATGKHPLAFRHIVRRLGLSGLHICLNGAALWHAGTNQLEGAPLTAAAAHFVLNIARQVSLPIARFTDRRIMLDPGGDRLAAILNAIDETSHVATRPLTVRSPVWKFLTLCPTGDGREPAVREKALDRTDVRIVRSSDRFLEFVPPGVSKGAALRTLCARLGIDTGSVWAFGDHMNDLEMLRVAGRSVTFTTSPEEVQRAANVVISPGQTAVADYFASLHMYNGRN